jgi:hypothetical protein
MALLKTSVDIIQQLKDLLVQLDQSQYTRPVDLLSSNTIGKHVRHIVEFYECLLKGVFNGVIDYDARERNLSLETDIDFTKNTLDKLIGILNDTKENATLKLAVCYQENNSTHIDTTLYRELAYNIEHAVHHFAIIQIALKQEFPQVSIPKNFGIAYSTVKYQESQCAQ